MKVDKKQADFKPIELTITIETQEELVTLVNQLDKAWNTLHDNAFYTLSSLTVFMREALLRSSDDD